MPCFVVYRGKTSIPCFRSCGCSSLQLADQAGYGFWRANEGISVEELTAPEQISVYFSKRRFVANSRPSRLYGLNLLNCNGDGFGFVEEK